MQDFLSFLRNSYSVINRVKYAFFLTIPTSDSSEMDSTNIVTPTVTAVPRNEKNNAWLIGW